MENLYSQKEAQALIEGLIPEPKMRQCCLHMFMDAIDEANSYGPNQWYIEPAFDGHIWLVTGRLVTCSLVEDRIWFSLNRQLMDFQAGTPLICDGSTEDWNWEPVDLDDPTWVHVATVINGFYTPGQNHQRIWPQLRRLLFESIYQSVLTPQNGDYTMPKVHSPGILAYVQDETQRKVRDIAHYNYHLSISEKPTISARSQSRSSTNGYDNVST